MEQEREGNLENILLVNLKKKSLAASHGLPRKCSVRARAPPHRADRQMINPGDPKGQTSGNPDPKGSSSSKCFISKDTHILMEGGRQH